MSSIESYFNGKKLTTKEELKDLIVESRTVKRLGIDEIRTVLTDLTNVLTEDSQTLKRFQSGESKVNELFRSYVTTGILENRTVIQHNNVAFYHVDDRTFFSLLDEIYKDVSYGKRVSFVINSANESNTILKYFKKLETLFTDGLLNLILKEGQKDFDNQVIQLNKSIKNPMPVFVLFREGDYISAIESMPDALSQRKYKTVLLLVHESQIKVVKELLDQLWTKLVDQKQYSTNEQKEILSSYTYELVNYDLNAILDNNQYGNVNSNQITLLAFRDKFDAVKQINHCPDVPFVSIWNRNITTSNFVSENLTTTSLVLYNTTTINHHVGALKFDYLNSEPIKIGHGFKLAKEQLNDYVIVKDFMARKPSKLEANQLVDHLVSKLDNVEVISHLNTFYHKMDHMTVSKNGIFYSRNHPVGFVSVIIDQDDNVVELFSLIVFAILSGNVVYLSLKKGLANYDKIEVLIHKLQLADNYFKKMIVLDEENVYVDQKLPPGTVLEHENKRIGSVLKYSEILFDVNFHYLQSKLFRTMTIFKPEEVFDNTN